MRRSTLARLERRLDAASAAVAPHWATYAMQLFGDALKAAPEPVRDSVIARLRQLYRDGAADPAHHSDGVIAILVAAHTVAPDLARQVAEKLRIELPAPAGRNQHASGE